MEIKHMDPPQLHVGNAEVIVAPDRYSLRAQEGALLAVGYDVVEGFQDAWVTEIRGIPHYLHEFEPSRFGRRRPGAIERRSRRLGRAPHGPNQTNQDPGNREPLYLFGSDHGSPLEAA